MNKSTTIHQNKHQHIERLEIHQMGACCSSLLGYDQLPTNDIIDIYSKCSLKPVDDICKYIYVNRYKIEWELRK